MSLDGVGTFAPTAGDRFHVALENRLFIDGEFAPEGVMMKPASTERFDNVEPGLVPTRRA